MRRTRCEGDGDTLLRWGEALSMPDDREDTELS
jgi:hypothetical protein